MNTKLYEFANILNSYAIDIIFKIFGCSRSISADILNTEQAFGNEARVLLSAFVLQKPVISSELEQIVGKNLLDYMLQINLLKPLGKKSVSNYTLRYYNSNYFFSSDVLGIGYSEAIDSYISIVPRANQAKTALVLFSFWGIEAVFGLPLTTTVDIHTYKNTEKLVRINCELNNIKARIFTELKEIPTTKKYDRILSIPPFLPYVKGKTPRIVTAGNKGNKFLTLALELAGKNLSKHGKTFILGAFTGKHATIDAELSRYFANFNGTLVKTTRIPIAQGLGAKILNILLWNYIKHTNCSDISKITADFLSNFEQKQMDETILFVANITPSAKRTSIQIVDLSNKYYGAWLQ